MDAVQIVQPLAVEFCQLFVDADDSIYLVAHLPVGTPPRIFHIGTVPLSVSLYQLCPDKIEPLSAGADHVSLAVNGKVVGPVRIVTIFNSFSRSYLGDLFRVPSPKYFLRSI